MPQCSVVQGKNTEQQITTLNCPNFEFLFVLFVFVCLFVCLFFFGGGVNDGAFSVYQRIAKM